MRFRGRARVETTWLRGPRRRPADERTRAGDRGPGRAPRRATRARPGARRGDRRGRALRFRRPDRVDAKSSTTESSALVCSIDTSASRRPRPRHHLLSRVRAPLPRSRSLICEEEPQRGAASAAARCSAAASAEHGFRARGQRPSTQWGRTRPPPGGLMPSGSSSSEMNSRKHYLVLAVGERSRPRLGGLVVGRYDGSPSTTSSTCASSRSRACCCCCNRRQRPALRHLVIGTRAALRGLQTILAAHRR